MTTQLGSIAAMICELIETHMLACESGPGQPHDRPPHITSEQHGTRADIERLSCAGDDDGYEILLTLDDGSSFRVRVEETAR
ncbi:hypothetical protein KRZ98_16925 [Sphingobium sp. AS12]|uniref:hypothetical protein n=1 Tax=Sphingobium sp. AS12 TaxID=2849495 RepID=UPI000CC9402D|nr:hypothetical protein [Sphingobium sp. AS12]MBV2149930.1 hypothetical protein [Sphingobium sp. AS12]PKP94704.1 MAG: hypothetical protein CVT77_01455 [Alphaproteobacteria bacterium HGW-Alphaproteobacteria-16]